MEIRCSTCQHVGPAAEVRPLPSGVGLVCAACGAVNTLELGAPSPPTDASDAPPRDTPPRDTPPIATPTESPAPARPPAQPLDELVDWFHTTALDRLIPQPGDGPRCPKCASLVEATARHCPRCGLNLDDARRFAPGQAPWNRAPEGREAEHEQAVLLWRALEERWEPGRCEAFVAYVRDHDLVDLGIRKLQFRLVDHPDDALALSALRTLGEGLQSRILLARGQAEASAQQFNEDVATIRQRVFLASLAVWGVILVLVLFFFARG